MEVTAMSVKTVKAKKKNRTGAAKKKRTKTQVESDFEARLISVENDPNAPLIARELAPLIRERMRRARSGEEPYLTIEQIQEELGRR
jgi:hypothetical protein